MDRGGKRCARGERPEGEIAACCAHQRTAEHLAGILKYRVLAVKNIRFRREK